eukprot:1162093-Pelagomonas_calceolata.AAC.9
MPYTPGLKRLTSCSMVVVSWKEKKSYVSKENSPYFNQGKDTVVYAKARESCHVQEHEQKRRLASHHLPQCSPGTSGLLSWCLKTTARPKGRSDDRSRVLTIQANRLGTPVLYLSPSYLCVAASVNTVLALPFAAVPSNLSGVNVLTKVNDTRIGLLQTARQVRLRAIRKRLCSIHEIGRLSFVMKPLHARLLLTCTCKAVEWFSCGLRLLASLQALAMLWKPLVPVNMGEFISRPSPIPWILLSVFTLESTQTWTVPQGGISKAAETGTLRSKDNVELIKPPVGLPHGLFHIGTHIVRWKQEFQLHSIRKGARGHLVSAAREPGGIDLDAGASTPGLHAALHSSNGIIKPF